MGCAAAGTPNTHSQQRVAASGSQAPPAVPVRLFTNAVELPRQSVQRRGLGLGQSWGHRGAAASAARGDIVAALRARASGSGSSEMSLPSGEREKVLSLTRELNAMGEEAVRKRALAAGASKRDVDARIHGPRAEIAALILAAEPDSAAVSHSRRVAFDTAPLPAGLARVQSDAAPALGASRVDLASVDELLKTMSDSGLSLDGA